MPAREASGGLPGLTQLIEQLQLESSPDRVAFESETVFVPIGQHLALPSPSNSVLSVEDLKAPALTFQVEHELSVSNLHASPIEVLAWTKTTTPFADPTAASGSAQQDRTSIAGLVTTRPRMIGAELSNLGTNSEVGACRSIRIANGAS